MNDTFDLNAAAVYLGASARKTQELAASGELPGARIGKRWTFRRADLEQYLARAVEQQTRARRHQAVNGRRVKPATRRVPGRRTPHADL